MTRETFWDLLRRFAILAVIIALMISGYVPALACMLALVVVLWVWTHP